MPQLVTSILPIFGIISQMSLASKEKSAMDQSIYYSKHPEAINALVSKFQQPLSSGLTSGVGNVVNASLAEQGLSQAPGIQSQVLSQALAPYQQNEQQMAIAEAMRAIGLPAESLAAIQSVKGGTDLASLLKGILPGGSGGSSGGGYNTGWFPGSSSGDWDTGITLPTTGSGGGGSIPNDVGGMS